VLKSYYEFNSLLESICKFDIEIDSINFIRLLNVTIGACEIFEIYFKQTKKVVEMSISIPATFLMSELNLGNSLFSLVFAHIYDFEIHNKNPKFLNSHFTNESEELFRYYFDI
jgi:hypothetical protein